jgi:hypothetical protein
VTLYYLTLEEHLHLKRQKDHSEEGHRIVRIPEFGQILEATPDRSQEQLHEWRGVLEKLRRFFMSRDDLKVKVSYVYQREDVAQRGELTTGQYIRAAAQSYKQIKHTLHQLDLNLFDLGIIREQVTFPQPFTPANFPAWLRVTYPVGGSLLNQKFLGHYACLLDLNSEEPLPTWQGIEWLLEDYGLSRREEKSWDLVYKRLQDSSWSTEAPAAVRSNGQFCNCPRHFL